MRFYVGLHQPCDAKHFERCMVSVNRLRRRKSLFPAGEWLMDSGAFTELSEHGRYRHGPEEYAAEVRRWWKCGLLAAAVTQDYMCEPFILKKTGLTTAEHQRLTIERYDEIRHIVWPMVYIMPVLQGYWPEEYVAHIGQYGDRLKKGAWVGVGSVCKRNADVEEIEQVLMAVRRARPDLRLHGFGVKLTALESSVVRECLWSADSMAWSYSARKQGRDGNSWREAKRFAARIEGQKVKGRQFQARLF
jgi:hypothetical protein